MTNDITPGAVVVGIDGSDSSMHAAQWAGAVADKLGTTLHLMHSLSTPGSLIADAAIVAIKAAATADQHAGAQKLLTHTQQAVHDDLPGLRITTEAVSESADTALIKLSRTAELVVLGCDDVSRAAALLLGSTSLTVTTRADCPVVAWRYLPKPNTAPVVVGVDGTAAGTAALARAFTFADHFGAAVRAVHCWSTDLPSDQATIPYLIDWDAIEAAARAALRTAVEPWTKRYPAVSVECFVESTKPGRALLHHAEDAQLVAVGNHRANAISAALLGSTALNLLHHSMVPVLVCQAAKTS